MTLNLKQYLTKDAQNAQIPRFRDPNWQPVSLELPAAVVSGMLRNRRPGATTSVKQDTLFLYDSSKASAAAVVGKIGTPIDKESFSASTTALGLVRPSHDALEEVEIFSSESAKRGYPKDLLAVIEPLMMRDWYGAVLVDKPSRLSIPRGRNVGWPWFVSGMYRDKTDVLLYLYNSYVTESKREGLSLQQAVRRLETVYTPVVSSYGMRTSHTDKILPSRLSGRLQMLQGVEPRCRMIAISSKVCVLWNRLIVKDILRREFQDPVHCNDKSQIKRDILGFKKKYKNVYGIDQSKFDLRHGFERGIDCLRSLGRVFKFDPTDLIYEFSIPVIAPKWDSILQGAPAVFCPSGFSGTTAVNNHGSTLDLIEALAASPHFSERYPDYKARISAIWETRGSEWDFRNSGDDVIFACDFDLSAFDPTREYESIGLKVDIEPHLKYLGTIYEIGERPYPLYRFLQTTLFPDGVTMDPDIHIISRYSRAVMMDFSQVEKQLLTTDILPSLVRHMSHWHVAKDRNAEDMLFPTEAAVREAVGRVSLKLSAKAADLDSVFMTLTYGSGLTTETFDDYAYLGIDAALVAAVEKEMSLEELVKKVEDRLGTSIRSVSLLNRVKVEQLLSLNLRVSSGDEFSSL